MAIARFIVLICSIASSILPSMRLSSISLFSEKAYYREKVKTLGGGTDITRIGLCGNRVWRGIEAAAKRSGRMATDHQTKPSRNSWDQPSASEVKPQHTEFEMTRRPGQPRFSHEVAKRLKARNGVPWWSKRVSMSWIDGKPG